MHIAELIEDATPTPFWRLLSQVGVEHLVSRLPPALPSGEPPWSLAALAELKQRCADAGLTLSVIEDTPPMDAIRLGTEGREREIEDWCELLEAMGALGIPVLSYHYMAVLGFQRTSVMTPIRGGALSSTYDDAVMQTMPPAGDVSAEQLWASYEYFLARVLPVAEENGVRLALHPDDPPMASVRGIARIFCDVEGFDRALALSDSRCHGITLCQGNFALMTDDLPGLIRRWGVEGRIAYVHFRDVRGTRRRFVESFHDDGQTDMHACMRAYADIGYQGVLRSDHVPVMEGEPVTAPSYSIPGRLWALGYQVGLREAAQASIATPGENADMPASDTRDLEALADG